MKTKIIVEGPNNVGKTTWIKMLKNALGDDWEIEHCTEKTPMSEYDLFKSLSNNQKCIFDRHGVSELVYPNICGRKQQITEKELNDLYLYFDDKIILVFIFADIDFIIRACESKNEEFDKKSEYKEIRDFHILADKFSQFCVDDVLIFKHHWGETYETEIAEVIKRVYS